MKAMLFVREIGQVKFVQENGIFEDDVPDEDGVVVFERSGQKKAYDKGCEMCVNGSVESFQVWALEGEYSRVTKIEVQSNG